MKDRVIILHDDGTEKIEMERIDPQNCGDEQLAMLIRGLENHPDLEIVGCHVPINGPFDIQLTKEGVIAYPIDESTL